MNYIDLINEAIENEFLAELFPEKYNFSKGELGNQILELKGLGFVKEEFGNIAIGIPKHTSVSPILNTLIDDDFTQSVFSFLSGDLESAREYKNIFYNNDSQDSPEKRTSVLARDKKRIVEERKFFSLYEALRLDNASDYRGGDYVNALVSPMTSPFMYNKDVKVQIPFETFAQVLPDIFGYDGNYDNSGDMFNRGGLTLKGLGITFKCAIKEIPSGYGVYDVTTNHENILGAGLEVPMKVKLELGRFMSNNFEIVHQMVIDEKNKEQQIKKMENAGYIKRAFYKLVDKLNKFTGGSFKPVPNFESEWINAEVEKDALNKIADKAMKLRSEVIETRVPKKPHN